MIMIIPKSTWTRLSRGVTMTTHDKSRVTMTTHDKSRGDMDTRWLGRIKGAVSRHQNLQSSGTFFKYDKENQTACLTN